MTREELEQARHEIDALGVMRIYGYKHAYCRYINCCDNCDKYIRFWCKLICKIGKIQEKHILKICKKEPRNNEIIRPD